VKTISWPYPPGMMSPQTYSSRPLIRTQDRQGTEGMRGNWSAYGALRLKRRPSLSDSLTPCFPVIRRRRSGCSGASPTRTRCHTGTDRHQADLHWFIAFPHHQPSWVGANLLLTEQGGGRHVAFGYAVELHSWMIQPDPGQLDPPDSGFAHLRQAGPPGRCRKVF